MKRQSKVVTVCVLLSIVFVAVMFFLFTHPLRSRETALRQPKLGGADTKQHAVESVSNATDSLSGVLLKQYQNVPRWSTPLVAAAASGDLNAVKSLVAHGADVNQKPTGIGGETPLIIAIVHGNNEEVIDFLLEHGADPNIKSHTGMTALMYAVGMGDSQSNLVRKLVAAGADVNVKDKYGNSVLRYAKATPGATAIVEILKRAGAKD